MSVNLEDTVLNSKEFLDSKKCKVVGIDKFDGEDWLHGEYNTEKEALEEAIKQTKEAMKESSSGDIATVYYAYGTKGNYLGGDVWKNK